MKRKCLPLRVNFRFPTSGFQLFVCLFFSIGTCFSFAQTVYEPLHRDVYHFLDRLAARGVIEYHDLMTPLPRRDIARKLAELAENTDPLTPLERRELAFLQKDFRFELERLRGAEIEGETRHIAGRDDGGRWRLFSYRDAKFSLNLDPIYGQESGRNDGESQTHRWNGAYLYGYFLRNVGFSFDFRDNLEKGNHIDTAKAFTPVTGVNAEFFPEGPSIEYSEVRTTLAADWAWGRATLGKDFLQWGYAQSGKVVLSNKAPSFPFIRLDVQPTRWLRFNYFHGWLESDVVDSASVFPTLLPGQESFRFRDKFLASHTITVTPKRGLDLSIGESIVYSDKLEIAYLMPLMFFRLADHYLSDRENKAGSNAQLFFAVSSRNHIPNTHLYGELLVDDISISDAFDPERQVNHLGGTIGALVSDVPLPNLSFRGEYTRVNPFVYKHFIPTLLYNSSSYPLGHWMGQNADLLFGEIHYRVLRGLQGSVWAQKIRKGGEGEVADQYTLPHKPFLFAPLMRVSEWGVQAKYEILHDLLISARYRFTRITGAGAESPAQNGERSAFSVTLNYGF